MSQPTPYSPDTIFLSFQAQQSWFPGSNLDIEFNDIATTLGQILTNLKLLQRDDGKLGNATVTYQSLDPTLQTAGLQPFQQWVTGVTYSVNQVVFQSSSFYSCAIAHTSGVFATDLAAGDWTLIGSMPTFSGNVAVGGNLTVAGTQTFTGNAAFSGTVTGSSTATFGGVQVSIGGANPFAPPTQATPVSSAIASGGSYADSSAGNIFQICGWADNTGIRPTVGVFGQGRALGNGSFAWGGNFVAYSGAAGAFSQGVEIDFGVANGFTSQESNGLDINVGGTTGSPGSNLVIGLSFDQLASVAQFTDAIRFSNFANGQPYQNALINVPNAITPITPNYGIKLDNANFAISAIKTKGFNVDPSGNVTPNSIVGVSTNSNAPAGAIGEYVSASVAFGSPVALVNNTSADVTTITLTAGDWDVNALVGFTGSATTGSNFIGSVSTTANTLDGTDLRQVNIPYPSGSPLLTASVRVLVGPSRFALPSTTTIHLVANSAFSGGSCSAFGTIRARRIR